jgi:hypothetical protein
MPLTRVGLLEVMRRRRYAVESSTAQDGSPQSAIVGTAVSDDFEVVFDTLGTSRKARNLRRGSPIALVFGSLEGIDERTVQYEGIADEPAGADRERLVDLYLSVFPDGRERQSWPHLTYFRVTPRWLRFSDFNSTPPRIVELDTRGIAQLP